MYAHVVVRTPGMAAIAAVTTLVTKAAAIATDTSTVRTASPATADASRVSASCSTTVCCCTLICGGCARIRVSSLTGTGLPCSIPRAQAHPCQQQQTPVRHRPAAAVPGPTP